MRQTSILGIPYDANSSFLRGAAKGPQFIQEAFYTDATNFCTQDGTDLTALRPYWQDFQFVDFEREDSVEAYQRIFHKVSTLLNSGQQVISLGGDHSVTFPVIAAYAEKYPELHILQIDAHGDLYHDFGGNYYSHASPFARIMENRLANSLTQIGNRTLTPHQRQQAEKFDVSIIEMKDFNLNNLPELKGPLYLTFDLDVMDPAFAPGVSHHEPGGLSTREALQILEKINIPIVGADIVELNPDRDVMGMTAMLAAKLLKELLAKMIR